MTSHSRDLLECEYCVLLGSYCKSKSNIPYFYFLVYVWVTCKTDRSRHLKLPVEQLISPCYLTPVLFYRLFYFTAYIWRWRLTVCLFKSHYLSCRDSVKYATCEPCVKVFVKCRKCVVCDCQCYFLLATCQAARLHTVPGGEQTTSRLFTPHYDSSNLICTRVVQLPGF